MEVSRPAASDATLRGTRIGLLAFPPALAAMLAGALESAGCVSGNVPRTTDGPHHPQESSDSLETYDILIVFVGEAGPPSAAELVQTWQQPWLLFGPPECVRQNPELYLRADDVVFAPYSLNELLFRVHRTIHRISMGGQYSSKRLKPLVLLADDDPDMLTLLETVLRNSGWECHFAADGRQALAMARKLLPDLLVLDIEMPFLSGLEVLRRIRESTAPRAKVLLLTASSDLKHVEEGMSLGADDYLAKPFSHIALVRRVRKLLFPPNEISASLKKAEKPL